jgi:hypothetical protein
VTAPYIIRDEKGYWHDYQLPTAWDDKPVGVLLVVYLQPGETLDCQTLLTALKPALTPAPPGNWYRVTVVGRNVRAEAPNGKVVFTLAYNDLVQVVETKKVWLQTWGRVAAYKRGSRVYPLAGWVYMSSLE